MTANLRILVATGILGAAVALLRLDVAPIPTWFYVFAWYPTLVILDALVERFGGESLLARPRTLLAMLWWSAAIWLFFEAVNFRLRNWYYVFVPAHPAERWIGFTVSFATVVPAILLPERLLDRLGAWRDLRARPRAIRERALTAALWTGVALLGAVLAAPRTLYPLTWVAAWLVAEPLLYRADPDRSLFADFARGRMGRIARLLAAGLFAGAVWETLNAEAGGKWIYTVPLFEDLKLFEMPPLGFLGFPFFALEAWSIYQLLARYTRPAPIAAAAVCGAFVLAGIDRWTVSSVTPRVAELRGVDPETRERLAAGGIEHAVQLARLPVADIAATTGMSGAEAARLREAARLAALRGIGTRHAQALAVAGIGSVEALARSDPDSVWRQVAHGPRPTRAEVRVWVRAAQAAAGR